MDTHPIDQESPVRTQDLEATGFFDPPPTQIAGGATAEFSPPVASWATDPSATIDQPVSLSAPPSGGTTALAPEPDGATCDHAPTGDATCDFSPTAALGPASRPGPAPSGESRCGRYRLKRFHAKGGMGEIWVAEDPAVGRSVALKRMRNETRADQRRRFLIEAQVTGQLEHPGIVPVHELGVGEQGQPFYAMKFIRGQTLQKVIEEFHAAEGAPESRGVEQLRLLQIFISLCQTVAYAHSRGVLHRDLKPENVVLGPFGETLLLDWGIAKVMGRPDAPADAGEQPFVELQDSVDATETQAGTIMGTPAYMAPEVAAGRNDELDARGDVYLLGATLYEILTGRPPRSGRNVMEMVLKAQSEPAPAPRKAKPLIPKALNAICVKAMAFRKEDRYATALELAEDVQRYAAGEPVSAYPEGVLQRTWRWVKRRRKALGWAAAAALAAGLLVAGFVRLRDAELRQAEAQRDAQHLKDLEQARQDVKEFRRLADEARYFAAAADPVSERAPFFDPSQGEGRARDAVALAGRWGEAVDGLPLSEEREPVKKELYDLHLVLAQTVSRRGPDPAAAREVLAELDGAARLEAASRGLYRLRAWASGVLGDRKGAEEARRRVEDPQTPVTSLDHFLAGEQYRTESDGPSSAAGPPDAKPLEKAVEQYRLGLAIDPDHYWLHFQLGRCYLGLGRTAEAVEALGACVALRPDAPWGYSARGVALAQEGRYAEAERDLDRAVRLKPDTRPARLDRGAVYWLEAKNDEALADFEAVLAQPNEQRLIEAAYYRGQLRLQLGDVDKALADFDAVAHEMPDFRPVYRLRARVHAARGENDLARADLDACQGAGPAGAGWEVHARRGRQLRLLYAEAPVDQRDRPSAKALAALAVDELNKAAAAGARAAEVYDDLGAMLELQGRLEGAVAAYDKGLALDPGNLSLHLKRGWAYEQTAEHDKALADFTAAAGIDPRNAEAHSGLGYVHAVRRLPAEAQREADLALLYGSGDYLILHNVACIYASLSEANGRDASGRRQTAVAVLRRAVDQWRRGGAGPSEVELIKGEAAFQPLHGLPDFQKLLTGAGS